MDNAYEFIQERKLFFEEVRTAVKKQLLPSLKEYGFSFESNKNRLIIEFFRIDTGKASNIHFDFGGLERKTFRVGYGAPWKSYDDIPEMQKKWTCEDNDAIVEAVEQIKDSLLNEGIVDWLTAGGTPTIDYKDLIKKNCSDYFAEKGFHLLEKYCNKAPVFSSKYQDPGMLTVAKLYPYAREKDNYLEIIRFEVNMISFTITCRLMFFPEVMKNAQTKLISLHLRRISGCFDEQSTTERLLEIRNDLDTYMEPWFSEHKPAKKLPIGTNWGLHADINKYPSLKKHIEKYLT